MKYFSNMFECLICLLVVALWLAGFVIAKGFWSTLFCFIPFYSWYLVIERIFIVEGLI